MAQSHSRLNLFGSCPFAYKCYISKVPAAKSAPLILGDYVHRTIEAYLKHLKAKKLQTDIAEMETIRSKYLYEIPSDLHGDFITITDRVAETVSLNSETAEFERELAFTPDWQLTEWLAKDVNFRAKIDYLDYQEMSRTAIVRDWKTDNRIPPESEIKNSQQLKIYAMIASLLFPEAEEFVIELFYVRHGKSLSHTITAAEIPAIKSDIEKQIQHVESAKKFEPTPSSYCYWCAYTQHCPAFQKAQATKTIEFINSPEQATAYADELRFVKIRQKQLEETLKSYCDASGPIQAGDEILTYVPSETIDLNTKEVAWHLRNFKVDEETIWKAMSLTKTKAFQLLKKAFGKDKDGYKAACDDIVAKYGIVKPKTTFKFIKAGSTDADEE